MLLIISTELIYDFRTVIYFLFRLFLFLLFTNKVSLFRIRTHDLSFTRFNPAWYLRHYHRYCVRFFIVEVGFVFIEALHPNLYWTNIFTLIYGWTKCHLRVIVRIKLLIEVVLPIRDGTFIPVIRKKLI